MIAIEERVERARNYFGAGYNCAQSVVMAYADVASLTEVTAATVASGLGGGMGRLREVCGTVSGMAVLAGCFLPATDPADRTRRTENYALVQRFAEQFRQKNGAIVCRTLLGLDHAVDTPEPSVRTADYYRKRPCAEYVADAARIVGEYLNNRPEENHKK